MWYRGGVGAGVDGVGPGWGVGEHAPAPHNELVDLYACHNAPLPVITALLD